MSKQERRIRTEQTILDALRELVVTQGFRGVGINAVACRAKVSKELIYRYYGSLDNLVFSMIQQQDYWSMGYHRPVDDEGHQIEITPDMQVLRMLSDQIRQMRSQPDLQEIRRWELIDKSETTLHLAQMRESASLEFISKLNIDSKSDTAAIVGIMLAGILYLVLRSKTSPTFFGIDINTDEGWARLEDCLKFMVPLLLREKQPESTVTSGKTSNPEYAEAASKRNSDPDV